MEGLKTSPCKGCGRPIIWGITPDGKRIPMDARAPVYALTGEKNPGQPDGVVRAFTAYVTHFATCPKASDFSGSRNPQ